MANTFSQINIHCVFAVKGRANIITNDYKDELHQYISGILKNEGIFSLAVNGWQDHVHVFFELPVTISVSKIMQIVKALSSKWINENNFVAGNFQWQEGYGAFSYSKSQRHKVINYIKNQEEHHRIKSFREEYNELLELFEIEFDSKYIFEFYD